MGCGRNINDPIPLIKFVSITCSLTLPVLQYVQLVSQMHCWCMQIVVSLNSYSSMGGVSQERDYCIPKLDGVIRDILNF